MKKVFSVLISLIILLSLASCSLLRDATPKAANNNQANEPFYTETQKDTDKALNPTDTITPIETSAGTSSNESPTASTSTVGIYSEKFENGIYSFTNVKTYESEWTAGKDIVVFDVIPSTESELSGTSFRETWIAESNKISSSYALFNFMIVLTLSDDTTQTYNISSYEDTLNVDSKYLEVYLYDDIRYAEGEWHSHITDETTDASTVISSIKLTSGEKIDDVKEIKLTAFLSGAPGLGATVELTPSK